MHRLLVIAASLLATHVAHAAENDSTTELERPLFDEAELKRAAGVGAFGVAQLAVQYGALVALEPPNWKDHGNSLRPSYAKLRSNGHRAPVWDPEGMGGGGLLGYLQADGDGWPTNLVGHGIQGSEIYLRMRCSGYGWLQAAFVGAVHSTAWEYAVEGWNETPSAWDLAYTPIGGAVFGEVRYRAWRAGRDRWYVRALADPVGELWAVSKKAL